MNKSTTNQPQKYLELRLIYDYKGGKKYVADKRPTERGSVSIDFATAEIMNGMSEKTGIVYELAEVKKEKEPKDEKEYRKELFVKLAELGKTAPKNIKTEDLIKLIESE
jgi:hypothetical protein